MVHIGIKRALIQGGLLAMGLLIGTGSLFGIDIDDEKKVDLGSIDGLRVVTGSAEVRVIASESGSEGRVRLVGTSMQRASLSLQVKGGVAEARIQRPWKVPALERLRIEVYLPSKYGKDLSVKTSSGRISFEGFAFDDLSVETSSGGIEGGELKAETMALRSTSGRIRIAKAEAKTASLSASSGSITVEALSAADARMRASSGDIQVGGLAGNLDVGASSGRIAVRCPEYNGWTIAATASSGSVRIELPPDAAIVLRTKSSSGKVVSDFSSAQAGGKAGEVSVRTFSGAISILKK
jgi:lia operon protein LiaG